MDDNWIEFQAAYRDAIVPKRMSNGAGGFDLFSTEEMVMPAGESRLVDAGFRCAIPFGWVGIIKPRSSLAVQGITTDAGVIDSDYRGIVKVLLVNRTDENFWVSHGDRIAQMLVLPCQLNYIHVKELDRTPRGDGGFGSTGS